MVGFSLRSAMCRAVPMLALVAVAAAAVHYELKPTSHLAGRVSKVEVLHADEITFSVDPKAGYHPHTLTLAFSAHGVDFDLRLTKRTNLMAPGYTVNYLGRDGEVVKRETAADQPECFYQGRPSDVSVEGQAVLMTCDGALRGVVRMEEDTYHIEPAAPHVHLANAGAEEESASHFVVFRSSDITSKEVMKCGNADEELDAEDAHGHTHAHTHAHQNKPISSTASRLKSHTSTNAQPHTHGRTLPVPQVAVKHVGLYLVSDNTRYQVYGNNTAAHSLHLAHLATTHYEDSSFSPTADVVVVHQAVWYFEDMITYHLSKFPATACKDCGDAEVNIREMLPDFCDWATTVSTKPPGANDADVLHLLAHRDTAGNVNGSSGIVGLANLDDACDANNRCGVDSTIYFDDFVGATIAHEIGHNLGFRHDQEEPLCDEQDTFIMTAVSNLVDAPTVFSTCSKTRFNTFSQSLPCLSDAVSFTSECGNGIIEGTEQCDCGLSDCSGRDSCCDGATCTLTDGSACSNADPCCENCQINTNTSHIGRPKVHADCDFDDYCPGDSATVPDVVAGSGMPCKLSGKAGACHMGQCVTKAQDCKVQVDTEYTPCSDSAINQFNHGDFCFSPWCTKPNMNGCIQGIRHMSDGIPCASNKICSDGNCRSISSVNIGLNVTMWRYSNYSECSCSKQSRNATCTLVADEAAELPDDACFGQTPDVKRSCESNDTGVHCPTDDDITILGVTLTKKQAIIAGAGAGAGLIFLICLCCCCCKKSKDGKRYDESGQAEMVTSNSNMYHTSQRYT